MKRIKKNIDKIKNKLPRPISVFLENFSNNDLANMSASSTYYLILSIVPLLIMVMAVVPFIPVGQETIIEIISIITPDFAHEIIAAFINAAYTQSISLLSGSILVAVWSASQGMMGIMNGLNDVLDEEEKRNIIYIRFWSIIYTLALLVIFILMIVILVFGDQIFEMLEKAWPALGVVWKQIMSVKEILVLLPAMFMTTFMYTFIPIKKLRFHRQIPGALLCTVGWGLFSEGFSFYVDHFSSNSLYGTLATPMLLMLWLYFCLYILFLGAIFNKTIADCRHPDEAKN